MKTILVPFKQLDIDKSALGAAVVLARLFGSNIECLHVRPSAMRLALEAMPQETSGSTTGTAMAERWEKLMEDNRIHAAGAGRSFKSFCQRSGVPLADAGNKPSEPTASWIDIEGNEMQHIVSYAQASDLVVLGRAPASGHIAKEGIGDILMHCGTPVFLAASSLPDEFPRTVAIAWKNKPEAGHAVAAALPILVKAEKVVVLSVAEGDLDETTMRAAAERRVLTLTRRGIRNAAANVVPPDGNIAETILSSACAANADLLVMGAYGHSRTRELVFGGVTSRVLDDAPLPVLLAH